MAFEYKPINNNDIFPVAKDRINEIGQKLAEITDLEFVGTYRGINFDTIVTDLKDSGVYYLTQAVNQPEGAKYNGFVYLYKWKDNYAKVKYIPTATETEYVRTLYNNSWTNWDSVVLSSDMKEFQAYQLTDSKGQYKYNKTVNSKTMSGTQTFYGKLQDPPKPELNEGWISYIEGEGNKSSIVEFMPINSTSVYRRLRKMPDEKQNPNLILDSLFSNGVYPHYSDNTKDFKYAWEMNDLDLGISYDVTYKGLPTLRISDSQTTFPMFRNKPLEMNIDVKPGDKLTFSVYAMTYDKSKLKSNSMYLDMGKYDERPQGTNPNIGQEYITQDKIENGQWKLFQKTYTIPSDGRYFAPMLRLHLDADGSNGFTGYYALPKLEFGEERTPFITNEKDSKQYDEIWSNWLEYKDTEELNTVVPMDAETKYLDYVWTDANTADKTFQELIENIPRGIHSFFCDDKVKDSPSDKPVRGTIVVNYTANDPTNTHKATVTCVDTEGRTFNYHKEGNSDTLIKQAMTTATLWDGDLDFAEDRTIELNAPFNEFEYLAVTYWTSASGHDTVKWQATGKSTSINLYIRDFNIANNSSSTNIDFFEGYLSSEGTTKLKTGMSKNLNHSGTGNANVGYWNTVGRIGIKKIVGVQSN